MADDHARESPRWPPGGEAPVPGDGDLPTPEPLPEPGRPRDVRSGPEERDGEHRDAEPLPEPEPLGGGSHGPEEAGGRPGADPLPEPEPLEDVHGASGEDADDRSAEEGWVHYGRWRDVEVPPLREVTAPNDRDRGDDPAVDPLAAWSFTDLRDAAGRASCAAPEPERREAPAHRRQGGEPRERDTAAPDAERVAPLPNPGAGREEGRSEPPARQTGHRPGRTPFWGIPAESRRRPAPHGTAAAPDRDRPGPGERPPGERGPGQAPLWTAGQQPGPGGDRRPARPREPRFAPAYPSSPITSVTQGRPYVPPVPLPGHPGAGGAPPSPPARPGHPPPGVPTGHGASGPQPPPRWPASPPTGSHVRFAPPPSGSSSWPQPRFTSTPDAGSEDDVVTGTHRLHGATVALRSAVVVLVFLALPGPFLLQLGLGWALLALLGVTLGAVATSLVSWYHTRFGLREDRLVVQTGLFRQRSREVPLSRLQAVDLVRPLFMQVVGLSEVRLETAGGDRAEVRLRYLGRRQAEALRAALLAYAAGLSGRAPEAPETPLYQLRFSLLIGALVFRLPVLLAFVLFSLLIAAGMAFDEPGVLGGAVPLLLGLLHGFLGPLLRYIDFYASLSPDGLRVRYGVFQARMQTVPPGRVQAVRIVEPLLWRWLRVVRVEANIAGYAGQRQTDSATLLPVVPKALAYELLKELLPGSDLSSVRFVAAHRDGSREELGVNDSLFVTRRGVFCRVVEIVPHARMQSVRLRMGPLAKRRGTAAVEVETPPGPVRAHAPDRELGEARQVLDRVVGYARQARADTAGPERWAIRGAAD